MQTPIPLPAAAADLQAAVKKALHSASFAKFMTSAVSLALAEAREATGGRILPPGTGRFHTRHRHGTVAEVVESTSADGKQTFYLQREYAPCQTENAGKWHGHENRTDEQGHQWLRFSGSYVVDNFGTLVPVTSGGAA